MTTDVIERKKRPAVSEPVPLEGPAYDISATALLLSLHISVWDACRTDKKVSDEVAKQHSTTAARAGHYNKYLIDVKAPSYVAVRKAAVALREFHYQRTLPWSEGWQIIKGGTAYTEYSKEFRKLVRAYEAAVEDFVADFPRLHANAKVELNGLYKASDYPSEPEVREKFGVGLRKQGVPTDDLRVAMSKAELEEVKADIRADVSSSIGAAMEKAWERLRSRVDHVATRLAEPPKVVKGEEKGPVFRDSLVENLREECALLASLNLLNDPRLDEMRYEAERLIKGINPKELRESKELRDDVAAKAAALSARMAGYMKGLA